MIFYFSKIIMNTFYKKILFFQCILLFLMGCEGKKKSMLGYNPKISLEEGIKEFLNWHKTYE